MFVAPPGYQPIYNPSIPYVGPIYGGLRPGMSVYIQGTIHHHITRFEVNLQCGEFDGSDIGLHINPRFDGWDKVVFNTFQSGSWEREEKVHHMPFRKGETFELIIVVSCDGYQINVNGKEYHLYQHRLPVERVCALKIAGDVQVQTINIIGGFSGGMGGGYPAGGTGEFYPGMGGGMGGGYPVGGMPPGGYPGDMGIMGGGGNLPIMGGQPIYNPTIPFSNMIPGGMSSKRTIIIRGMVPYGANRFCINFIVGGTRDIAFHLNPRILEGIVVRNSQLGGLWGQEEQEIFFNPFQEGQYFDLSIRCGNWRFKVYVNGQHMCNFIHRYQQFTQIDMILIEGDVQISYIHF
ncbi:galectin-4-like [Denticeps clupeoides]|uniref:galectin-4-like n=1 Tax=Denticeps clupeoides TaxID=299321 RepID=UPI0010A4C12E|nr:galectin-4-like [Denticeps clupeoides]